MVLRQLGKAKFGLVNKIAVLELLKNELFKIKHYKFYRR